MKQWLYILQPEIQLPLYFFPFPVLNNEDEDNDNWLGSPNNKTLKKEKDLFTKIIDPPNICQ